MPGVAVIVGVGLTLTVTTIGVPLQLFAEGVIVYTAVPKVVPVVLKVCAIDDPVDVEAPLTPV